MSDAVAALAGLFIVVALGIAAWRWEQYTKRSVLPWEFTTALDEATLRRTFEHTAGTWGWQVTSSVPHRATIRSTSPGQKQEITLTIDAGWADRRHVVIAPSKVAKTWGAPVRPHTIRMRVQRFIEAVRLLDPSINATAVRQELPDWPYRLGSKRPL